MRKDDLNVTRATIALLASILVVGCTTSSGMEATPTFEAARLLPTTPPRQPPAQLPYSDTRPPRSAMSGGEWVIDNVGPTSLYQLPVRMSRLTLVLLPEGESVNKALGGDVDGFVVEGAYAENRAAIAVTPMLPGRRTNLIVTTTGGAYNFMLSSREGGGWMSRVDVRRAAPLKPASFQLVPAGEYERLVVATPDGDASPAWAPVEVWADATKLVVRFAEPLPLLPGLYAGQEGEQVVNYRVQRTPGYVTLVTDRRVTEAELRLDRETVRITAPAAARRTAGDWRRAARLQPRDVPAPPDATAGPPPGGAPPSWGSLPAGNGHPPASPPRAVPPSTI